MAEVTIEARKHGPDRNALKDRFSGSENGSARVGRGLKRGFWLGVSFQRLNYPVLALTLPVIFAESAFTDPCILRVLEVGFWPAVQFFSR